jgi:hypothetical protein
MLSADEAAWLLNDLCIRLGFCLPREARERLTGAPPPTIDEFTAAVFVAEGLDPSTAGRRIYRAVQAMVADAFRRSEEREGVA